MVTVTKNGLLIEMQGANYGADEIQTLNKELIQALQAAVSTAEDRGMDYFMLFDLLEAISPTFEQLQAIHPHSSYTLNEKD